MTAEGSDRRRAQRVTLDSEMPAVLGEHDVVLQEIGLAGARVEGSNEVEKGTHLLLRFQFEETWHSFDAHVARCLLREQLSEALGELRYDIGLEFTDLDMGAHTDLRRIMLSLVSGMLSAQKANARGEHWSDAIKASEPDPEATMPQIFASSRLLPSGVWQSSMIMKPVQPRDGFTVRSSMSQEEIDKLRKSYEEGSEEERHLIRVMAEISTQD